MLDSNHRNGRTILAPLIFAFTYLPAKIKGARKFRGLQYRISAVRVCRPFWRRNEGKRGQVTDQQAQQISRIFLHFDAQAADTHAQHKSAARFGRLQFRQTNYKLP